MANSTLCENTANITTNVKINRIGDTTYRFSNVNLSNITKLSIGTFCYNNTAKGTISNEIVTTKVEIIAHNKGLTKTSPSLIFSFVTIKSFVMLSVAFVTSVKYTVII